MPNYLMQPASLVPEDWPCKCDVGTCFNKLTVSFDGIMPCEEGAPVFTGSIEVDLTSETETECSYFGYIPDWDGGMPLDCHVIVHKGGDKDVEVDLRVESGWHFYSLAPSYDSFPVSMPNFAWCGAADLAYDGGATVNVVL